MDKINIIDTFSLNNFKKEYTDKENYEVKAALFLTYSLKPKVILALLHDLFYENVDDNNKSNEDQAGSQTSSREETLSLLDSIVKDILERKVEQKDDTLKDEFAVYYNNGSRSAEEKLSIADSIAMRFAYPVDMGKASFHPKVYIVKYGPKNGNGESIYRIMIGSHNLSVSNAIEYGYCFDRVAKDSEEENNECWKWLRSLLTPFEEESEEDSKKNVFSIMDQRGGKLSFDKLPVVKEIMKGSFSDKIPEILAVFSDIKPGEVNKVFTPFITKDKVKDTKAEIYTTAFELKKRGYVLADPKDKDTRKFWIFAPKEGTEASKYGMPHYKVYHIGDDAYVGSLNFTHSAFKQNKEVLIKIDAHKIDSFEKSVLPGNGNNGWYTEKPFKKNPKEGDDDPDIYENFRNWIRDKLSVGKVEIVSKDDKIELTLSINGCVDIPDKVELWRGISKKTEEGCPDGFGISICPENMPACKKYIWNSDSKSGSQKWSWILESEQADLMRSSAVCFYLNDGEREYPPYCRVYPLSAGKEILEEKTDIAFVADWAAVSAGGIGISESPSGDAVKKGISITKFRKSFSLYSLDDILKVPSEKRKEMIGRMKSKLEILKKLMGRKDDSEFKEKVLKKIGCLPADQLVWEKLIEQGEIIPTYKK